MKKRIIFLFLAIFVLLYSCGTDQPVETEEAEPVQVAPVVEPTPAPAPVSEPEPVIQPEPEPVIIEIVPEPEPEPEILVEPEPSIFVDEPEVVIIDEVSEEIQEYSRSISTLEDGSSITEDTFLKDKQEILEIISKLETIMKGKKYNDWLNYLTPDSKTFWSNKKNLSELSQKLFSKYNFELKNLREYFEYFFIPARKGRVVDEIRYVTPKEIKAVQYKDKEDIIYYYFEKLNGKWLIRLDTSY